MIHAGLCSVTVSHVTASSATKIVNPVSNLVTKTNEFQEISKYITSLNSDMIHLFCRVKWNSVYPQILNKKKLSVLIMKES